MSCRCPRHGDGTHPPAQVGQASLGLPQGAHREGREQGRGRVGPDRGVPVGARVLSRPSEEGHFHELQHRDGRRRPLVGRSRGRQPERCHRRRHVGPLVRPGPLHTALRRKGPRANVVSAATAAIEWTPPEGKSWCAIFCDSWTAEPKMGTLRKLRQDGERQRLRARPFVGESPAGDRYGRHGATEVRPAERGHDEGNPLAPPSAFPPTASMLSVQTAVLFSSWVSRGVSEDRALDPMASGRRRWNWRRRQELNRGIVALQATAFAWLRRPDVGTSLLQAG